MTNALEGFEVFVKTELRASHVKHTLYYGAM